MTVVATPGRPALRFRLAMPDDRAVLIGLMRDFHLEDRIHFDDALVARGLDQLWSDDANGEILLWLDEGDRVVGYAVLTVNFSLEQGGRHALLDELYLGPAARGRGWGRQALALAEQWARGRGFARLRLEVNRHNAQARALYLKLGYADEQRDLLTLDLTEPASP